METFLIQNINKYGYFGILLLIAIENIFPPIPSEIILTFSGFMTTYTNMTELYVILFATLGSIIGAAVLYFIGTFFTEERLYKIIDYKFISLLGFKKSDVTKAINWFNNKGKFAVLIGRCIPIVRSLISIPAGVAKMNFAVFLIYTTIGTLVWNTVLVYLGAFAGSSWRDILKYIDEYSTVVLILIILITIIGGIFYFKKRKLNKKK